MYLCADDPSGMGQEEKAAVSIAMVAVENDKDDDILQDDPESAR
jgi:hypothetical protein